ncbi:MAG: DNA gyrase subunit A [Bacteroides sp. 43_108]|nr:MAG: DNA gyrase subunit A [Bacteroides sp. 43_108]
MLDQDRIIKIDINETMKSSYIDYSMSVIVARALPDVRDGFKPVHRRILYGMMELGNTYDKPHKKCARIVGEVLGKYHPHGDSSVYGALVRLAQPWAMRCTLVDGQGNFGSVDGDSPAAMRYTEARLTKAGEAMMDDLYKETVDFQNNFDDSLREPTVMPTRIPNLLVNGASGIAVGMATNIPTHNLGEVIDGCVAYIDNPEITSMELMKYVKAPDFPTGGIICGLDGVKDAYETGKGRIVVRSKVEIESDVNHDKIVVHEIPYNVNKAELIKKIADLVNEKRIEGISNVNDESDREGMRIVIDVKREANANVILNKLYKMTELQSSFSVNTIALVKGRPKLLTLRDCIKYFVEHRHDVVIRRTIFDKRKAEERAHILKGLIIASDNIDEVVHIIRAAKSPQEAISELMKRFELDDIQAKAIVEMRLRQLTGLEQDKLHAEYDDLMKLIDYLNGILNDPEFCKKVMKDELLEVKEKWSDERRTFIDYTASEDFNPEDFYPNEPVVITVSHLGYIKRTPLAEFRTQARGGVGAKGGSTRDEDFIEHIYPGQTHNTMMFFTQKGRCFWMKVYEIPEGTKSSKGRAVQNLLNIDSDDKVTAFICVENINDEEWVKTHNLIFCTKNGTVKKSRFELYSHPRSNGLNAINIVEGDKVIEVCLTSGNDDIIIANRNGRAIRFNENAVRLMGRTATGVRGLRLDDDGEDEVVGMVCLACNKPLDPSMFNENEEEADDDVADVAEEEEDSSVDVQEQVEDVSDDFPETIMVVSEKGYGKRSNIGGYRITHRGGKGVKTLNITEKTGKLVAIKSVTDDNDLMIINKSGIAIRLAVSDVRVQGRATQGVSLINLKKRNDVISSVCKVEHVEPENEENSQETSENTESIPENQN